MKFIERIFKLLTVVVTLSILIPLLMATILYFGHDTQIFAWVMLNAALIGVVNLIALHYLKKWVIGINNHE